MWKSELSVNAVISKMIITSPTEAIVRASPTMSWGARACGIWGIGFASAGTPQKNIILKELAFPIAMGLLILPASAQISGKSMSTNAAQKTSDL